MSPSDSVQLHRPVGHGERRMHHHFDVLTVTDCRLPGGTATSTAEEINAQARTLLRSGLLHIDSPLVSRSRPLNGRLRRHIELGNVSQVLPIDHVDCDLVVIRHPKVALAIDPETSPVVSTTQCVVVVNQVPTVDGDEIYDLTAVAAAVESWLGVRPRFAPIGPLVREAVVLHDPHQELEPQDWVNVIDVDEWRSQRLREPRSPIVVGRHSRDHYIKFPDTRQALLAAYPTAPGFAVQMLGGRKQITRILGTEIPANWRIHEFDSIEPRRFLDDLDIYAYFHHPDLVEAFGRNLLEALAAGIPIVTHPHFSRLFGDAITTATPSDAERVIRELTDDRARYRDQVDRGRAIAVDQFGYTAHIQRIEELLGRSVTHRQSAPASKVVPERQTALFIGPNGAGLGHLTRLMALARRSADRWTPHFLTFSTAAETVERQGFPVTYVPSRTVTGSTSATWHSALAERLGQLVADLQPAVIVIDSTEPYRGLLRCLRDHPQIPVVWSRRGMWKEGVSNPVLEAGEAFFDLIIQPGDLAAEFDTGATSESRESHEVGPITLLDKHELGCREDARSLLGVGEDDIAVLVQLGAGNINDTTVEMLAILDGVIDLPAVKLFVVQAPISTTKVPDDSRISTIKHFPLARVMRGFDFAVAAAGYNTFHELLLAEVPTIFLPNTATTTDDQSCRARWAASHDLALVPETLSSTDIALAVKRLTIDENRHLLQSNLGQLKWPSGGRVAIDMISDLVENFVIDEESLRRENRHRSFAAVEVSIESRAAHKRLRLRARQTSRHHSKVLGSLRAFAIRFARRTKRMALRRLGYQRLVALYILLPARVQRRVERVTNTVPGRTNSDPSRLRVPPGRMMSQNDESQLVSILFAVEPAVDNEALADAVAHLQSSMRNFKPLFLTRSLHAEGFRRYGYLWEHESPMGSRLEQVLHWYRPDFVVEVDDLARVTDQNSALQGWLRSRAIP